MLLRVSPNMRSITISGGLFATRPFVHPHHLPPIIALAFLLPFVFILAAVVTLEGVNRCTSFVSSDCLGRRLGPRFLSEGDGDSMGLVKDLYKVLIQVNSEEIPVGDSKFDAKTFAITLKAKMENMDEEEKISRLAEQLHKHFAASAIPKGIHCLSLCLTDEYSSNAHARKQLPSPELLPLLSDNSYQHFILATENFLAASVVVTSAKTYPGMHSWFALNPPSPAIVEVKGVHQFDWLTRENVPVLEAVENHHSVRKHYHGNHDMGAALSDNPRVFASHLQARSPKYISLLNHLRVYLPELFPNLNKVAFLDDDVVVQRDLSPLWAINIEGKVNGAVETSRGEDKWVMSKRFKTYFNFSHPLIADNLDPDECAWAYGMNIFDLNAWRKTSIRDTYHYWVKKNLKSNLTLWKLGTLPPALVAFRGNAKPIDPSWHMLGLGYQEKSDLNSVRKTAVIHYNGQSKPWLEIGFKHLQHCWTKHVNYSHSFIRNCDILEPQY
ncbi:Polygalacturonate 4-alpha-galacturonosyltransferase protein [Dioscorea alata]|uniref:Polygalacturonate 4-alpha-galacturonosyltransferase protein n=1 Tax=Dioscorea alata TaxID=55571 RepID=A0ACB7UWM5_DIOAL|nr:Polygalacturonate 4-alpha-galacturonosyltransferase protein [Dioscorea alata]